MTTAPAAVDTTAPAAEPGGGLAFLSKAIKATGYGRVGAGALAAGEYAGHRAHLIVPLERISAADVKVRIGGTRLVINTANDREFSALVNDAAETAARACGIEFGEVTVSIREARKPGNGSDPAEAIVVAVVDAIDKASEHGLATSARTALVSQILGGRAAGLAANAPVIASEQGLLLARPDSPARLLVVIAAPVEGGAGVDDLEPAVAFGTLATPPTEGSDPHELAAWLTACSGIDPATDPSELSPAARAVVAATGDTPEAFGVIGGHTPDSAVLVLLPPDGIMTAQQLTHQIRGLPEGWRASIARTAIG